MAPKAFAVLTHLVANAGRLVTQDELLQAVWEDTFVQPEILRRYILEIRKVLEDPPRNSRFIATLPKRGYEFIAPVSEDGTSAGVRKEELQELGRLVGREAALAELNRRLEQASSGQRQVVFVAGEAGIGKTTLVDSFQMHCAGQNGIRIARGECVEGFGGREAYYPVLEAVGHLIRGPGGSPVIQTLGTHAPTWLIQFPAAVKPEQREHLQREILGATRERMVRELCEALETLTADQPLLLLLEDLQWVDGSTLDLISALSRRRGAARIMLVATYRPVDLVLSGSPLKVLKQDLLIHRLCAEINLERLNESDVEQYLARRFAGNGLPGLLSGLIHRRSDGNPLFMVAMVEELIEKGLVAQDTGHWKVTVSLDRLDPGVPETLQQMLELQLEHLSAPEQRLLKAASVAGQRFSAASVRAVLETDFAGVEDMCESLAARQQFLRRIPSQEFHYEFRHALYREALYRRIPASQLRQLHLRMAQWMESLSTPIDPSQASELASHFEAASVYPRAVQYLILSAANAARRYAHADSVQLLRRALDLLAHIPAGSRPALEIEILERISDALYAQGEMEQSGEVDQRVADLAARAGMKTAQVNALTRLARALAFVDPDRCIIVCERALEVSRTHNDALLEARAEMLAACWRIVTNGWNKSDAGTCEAARGRIRRLSNEVPAYYEILYAHVQCTQGDYEGACQTAAAGISRSLEADNLVVYLSAHSSLAHALLHLGRWGELLRVITEAREVVEKNRNAPWLGIFTALLGWLRLHACDYQGALRVAEGLLETHTGEPAGQVRTMAMVTAAYALLETGNNDRAIEHLTKVCDRQARPRFFFDWYWRMIARLGLGRAWLAKGDAVRAAGEAGIFLEAALAGADPALQALGWELQARVAIAQGGRDRARDAVNQALAIVDSRRLPGVAWRVHSLASELLGRELHRARAAASVAELARSFREGDPLREALLSHDSNGAGHH